MSRIVCVWFFFFWCLAAYKIALDIYEIGFGNLSLHACCFGCFSGVRAPIPQRHEVLVEEVPKFCKYFYQLLQAFILKIWYEILSGHTHEVHYIS